MATGLLPAAEAWFNSPIRDYFPGQTVAGFSPRQRRGMAQLERGADAAAARGAQLSDIYTNYLSQGPQWNPYLNQVARNYSNEMGRQFRTNVMPTLRGSQVASNSAGSSAAGIQTAQSADDLNRTIGQQLSSLYAQGFADTQDRYLSALGQAPSQFAVARSAAQLPGTARMTTGAMEQMINQKRLDDEMKRWAWYRDAPVRRLQTYGGLIPNIMESSSSSTSSSTGNSQGGGSSGGGVPGWVTGAAGGLSMAAPSLANWWKTSPSNPSNYTTGGTTYTPDQYSTWM